MCLPASESRVACCKVCSINTFFIIPKKWYGSGCTGHTGSYGLVFMSTAHMLKPASNFIVFLVVICW